MSLAASPSHLRTARGGTGGSTGRPHPAAASGNTAILLALTSTASTLAPLAGARITVQEISAQEASSMGRPSREEDDAECPMLLAA